MPAQQTAAEGESIREAEKEEAALGQEVAPAVDNKPTR